MIMLVRFKLTSSTFSLLQRLPDCTATIRQITIISSSSLHPPQSLQRFTGLGRNHRLVSNRYPASTSEPAFQTPRDKIPPVRKVLTAVKEGEIVRAEDAAILDDALDAGQVSISAINRARLAATVSFRCATLYSARPRLRLRALQKAFSKHIGEEVGKHSPLAEKSVVLIVKSEEALLRFLDDLPADIRAAVRTLIDDLKKRSGQPQFPPAKAPSPEHNDPTERRRTKSN
jgi:hypothetical protein